MVEIMSPPGQASPSAVSRENDASCVGEAQGCDVFEWPDDSGHSSWEDYDVSLPPGGSEDVSGRGRSMSLSQVQCRENVFWCAR